MPIRAPASRSGLQTFGVPHCQNSKSNRSSCSIILPAAHPAASQTNKSLLEEDDCEPQRTHFGAAIIDCPFAAAVRSLPERGTATAEDEPVADLRSDC